MQVLAPGEILVGREGGWEGVGWGEAGASEVKMGSGDGGVCVCILSLLLSRKSSHIINH